MVLLSRHLEEAQRDNAGDAAADASEAAADAPAPLPPDPTCGDDGRTPGAGACDPHAPYDYETCNAIGDSVCNVAWACVSNDLCASADFLESGGSGSSGGGGPLHYLANGPGAETNARCVITALRDNTRGRVRFSIAQPQGGFSQTLEILGGSDRRVYGIAADIGAFEWQPPPDPIFANGFEP